MLTKKQLKDEINYLKEIIEPIMKDWDEFLEWKKTVTANRETAASTGRFYISADDAAVLERLIQEVNKDPDLAVLMTTAQGTTLSLRTHPQSLNRTYNPLDFGKGEL